jgi:hypothetical protein
MAVSARLWFHFCTAIGWFPAALNLFSGCSHRDQLPEATSGSRTTRTEMPLNSACSPTAVQYRPLDAAENRSSGHGMVPIGAPIKGIQAQTGVLGIDPGQLIVPGAANGWYY